MAGIERPRGLHCIVYICKDRTTSTRFSGWVRGRHYVPLWPLSQLVLVPKSRPAEPYHVEIDKRTYDLGFPSN